MRFISKNKVKGQFGRELSLNLDCNTRWSSLRDMVERFLKLRTYVTLALLELQTEISFCESEWQLLSEIYIARLSLSEWPSRFSASAARIY
jgi:hypothetical protein